MNEKEKEFFLKLKSAVLQSEIPANAVAKLESYIKGLEKENSDLKARISYVEELPHTDNSAVIDFLLSMVEKMKCCGKCKHYNAGRYKFCLKKQVGRAWHDVCDFWEILEK